MKNLIAGILTLTLFSSARYDAKFKALQSFPPPVKNLFIITIDGFRWQELFQGADSVIINNENFTPDNDGVKSLYWASTAEERRKRLMPFFWNVIGIKGQLYGNREYSNKDDVANPYSISYPGYSEIFTGNADVSISSNAREANPNLNILEWLDENESYKGKVAGFASWDAFPFILNSRRSNLTLNSGYEEIIDSSLTRQQHLINEFQNVADDRNMGTRFDELTFLTCMEYVRKHNPRIVFLGFGEADECGHEGRYDLYLEKAANADRMIGELWHWVQSTPGYKDNTTFIITTDHGRGNKKNKWSMHGPLVKGSSQTWLAIMGPGIIPFGEIKEEQQIYQKQIAQTIAGLVGEKFVAPQSIAAPIFQH